MFTKSSPITKAVLVMNIISLLLLLLYPIAVHSFVPIQKVSAPGRLSPVVTPSSKSSRLKAENQETSLEGSQTNNINHVLFEFCTGCRWLTRSMWMAQELLTTFNDENLSAVTMVPSRPPPGARFVVSHCRTASSPLDAAATTTTIWDREKEDGFPAIKDLKQRIRDLIDPELYLGHSDNEGREKPAELSSSNDTSESASSTTMPYSSEVLEQVLGQAPQPNVSIQYCTGCRWMLRSAYFATELMTTFEDEVNSITLIPSRPPEKGGIFVSSMNGTSIALVEESVDRCMYQKEILLNDYSAHTM